MRTSGSRTVRCPSLWNELIFLALGSPQPSTSHEAEVVDSSSAQNQNPSGVERESRKKNKSIVPRSSGSWVSELSDSRDGDYLDLRLDYPITEVRYHVGKSLRIFGFPNLKCRSNFSKMIRAISAMFDELESPVALYFRDLTQRFYRFGPQNVPKPPTILNQREFEEQSQNARLLGPTETVDVLEILSSIYKTRTVYKIESYLTPDPALDAFTRLQEAWRMQFLGRVREQAVMNFASQVVGLNFANLLRSLINVVEESSESKEYVKTYLQYILAQSICYEFSPRRGYNKVPTPASLYRLIWNFQVQADKHAAAIASTSTSEDVVVECFLRHHQIFFASLLPAASQSFGRTHELPDLSEVLDLSRPRSESAESDDEREDSSPSPLYITEEDLSVVLTETAAAAAPAITPTLPPGVSSSSAAAFPRFSYYFTASTSPAELTPLVEGALSKSTPIEATAMMDKLARIFAIIDRNKWAGESPDVLQPEPAPLWILWPSVDPERGCLLPFNMETDLEIASWVPSELKDGILQYAQALVNVAPEIESTLLPSAYARLDHVTGDISGAHELSKQNRIVTGLSNGHSRFNHIWRMDRRTTAFQSFTRLARGLTTEIMRLVQGDVLRRSDVLDFDRPSYVDKILRILEVTADIEEMNLELKNAWFGFRTVGILNQYKAIFCKGGSTGKLGFREYIAEVGCDCVEHFMELVSLTDDFRRLRGSAFVQGLNGPDYTIATEALLEDLWSYAFERHRIDPARYERLTVLFKGGARPASISRSIIELQWMRYAEKKGLLS